MDKVANDSAALLDAAAWYLQLGKLDRAGKALEVARIQGASGDPYWNLVVATKRMQGNLAAAIEQTQAWMSEEPDSALAQYCLAALTCQVSNAKPDDAQRLPLPFRLCENFLPEEKVGELRSFLRSRHEEMYEAGVLNDKSETQINRDIRRARVAKQPEELLDWFLPLVEAQLPQTLPILGMKPFPIGRREVQLTASYDGDFYKAHRDFTRGRKDAIALRRVTFVCYFALPGGSFSEGHLRLYDMDRNLTHWRKDRFTALEPKHNRLVMFNSEALHEVMPVKAPGGRLDDGRFTLNGWFNVTPEAGELDLRLDP